MHKKKNILIATPFLENIGGTEIEAFSTAIHLYDTVEFNKIIVFSPKKNEQHLFVEMIGEREINIINYPAFFNSKLSAIFNGFFRKIGFKFKLTECFFWLYWHFKTDVFFVLTYPKAVYFFPILAHFKKSKKYIAKITMWQFTHLPQNHFQYYSKFNKIIVFNEEQKIFWNDSLGLSNTISRDILISNENQLLNLKERNITFNDEIIFGYLGRISREKNLEDMILLIDFLNNKNNKKCKLIIQGNGDLEYLNELELLVIKYDLSNFVTFKKEFISPIKTHAFYQNINVFLVTSKLEGGPMTALEATAAGCYVMGYNIGAMEERFRNKQFIVNQNFEQLCVSTLNFVNLPAFDIRNLIGDLRNYYIQNLSNSSKISDLKKLFY